MDSLRLDTLAGHLVAWHNSHPLARRIDVSNVTGLGYVVLPFAPTAATLAAAASAAAAAAQAAAEREPDDEPIEVLIDAPDLDLSIPAGDAADTPEPTIVLTRGDADAAPTSDAAADAVEVVELIATEQAEPAAGVPEASAGTQSAEPVAPSAGTAATEADSATASESSPPATPEPTAAVTDLGEGATLRERAMARAQQMALEAARAAAAPAAAGIPAEPRLAAPTAAASAAPGAPAWPAAPAATAAPPAPEAPAARMARPQAPAAPAPTAAQPTPAAAAPVAADKGATSVLHPLFSEDFIPPLKPAAVAAFAAGHGADHASPGKDGLVRVVGPDPGMVYPVTEQRWLLTAQIEVGSRRTRVLVGAGLQPAVLGQRLRSTPRLLALAGALLVLVCAALGWLLRPAPFKLSDAAAAPQAGASATVAASGPPASAAVSTVAAASAPTPAASAPQAGASAPADVEPTLGRVELPSLGPVVDERRRAAVAAAEVKPPSAATAAIAGSGQAVPPPAVVGPAYAVSTRLLRTRFESEQLADAMRALLAGTGPPGLQVQALRSGEDWRVVVWPFLEQAQAEKARALLVSRGMKVAVIDF